MFRWADPKPEEVKTPPPPIDPRMRLLKWFAYDHLPEELQVVSSQFNVLANWMYANIQAGQEATVAMRKLLESKDCAVRAFMESMSAPHKVTEDDTVTGD